VRQLTPKFQHLQPNPHHLQHLLQHLK